MGKRITFFSLICLVAVGVSAQQTKIDSLELVLKNIKSNTDKVNVLCKLSENYLLHQPSKAKHYAEEALSLAIEIDYPIGEILALNHLGDYEFRQGNYAQSIQFASKSLHQAEAINDSASIAKSYRVLGNTNNYGLKRYDSALAYQLKAFKIYQLRKDYEMIAATCGSITWIYATTNQHLDEAHKLARLGVHLSDSLNNYQYLSYNYNSEGLIYQQENQLDSALKYFDLSIIEAQKVNDKAVIAFNKRLKASIFLKRNELEKALALYHTSLAESRKLNFREVVKNSYDGLSQSYAAMGNYSMAYKYSTLFNQLRDSLLNAEITQKALLIELEYEETKSKLKIRELQFSNEQAKKEKIIVLLSFGIALAFSIIIIFLITRNNQQRAKTNQLLNVKNLKIAEQNDVLVKVNATKDKLFSILGHDLRSPLNSLKGILGMVARKEVTGDEFISFVPNLNQQVIGITETLDNLLRWSQSQQQGWVSTITTIKLCSLISKCEMLFKEVANQKNISIINQVNPNETVVGDENQIELVFRNLIHNAIKFTRRGGSITIRTRHEENFVLIKVMDTGIGMTEDQMKHLFDLSKTGNTVGTQGEQGTGLGLHLCHEMAKENGGKIEVTSAIGEGTTFLVYLKSKLPSPL
jgi:two-component system, sensor histidine kinase and response regulator